MYKLVSIIAVGFFCFIVWVIFMANTGQSSVFFDIVKAVPYGDKVGHFFLFGFLTLFVNVAFKFKTFNILDVSIFIGTFSVSLIVLVEELSQYFIASRTLDITDLLADAIGISVFTLITYIGKRHLISGSSRPTG